MKLERRTCKCGCKRSWRCLPSSTSQYFSEYECAGKTPNEGRLEFTGKTVLSVRQNPKPKKKRNNRAYTRNHSKWDK